MCPLGSTNQTLANRSSLNDVPRYHKLHPRNVHGDAHPFSWFFPLPQSGWLLYLYLDCSSLFLKHPFNKKENALIVIMASAAANSALATEVLAVQRLFYKITPNAGASIFLLFSSQLIGYCFLLSILPQRAHAEQIRNQWLIQMYVDAVSIAFVLPFSAALLYPSKMLYPPIIPLVSMLDALFRSATAASKKLRVFWITFFA